MRNMQKKEKPIKKTLSRKPKKEPITIEYYYCKKGKGKGKDRWYD